MLSEVGPFGWVPGLCFRPGLEGHHVWRALAVPGLVRVIQRLGLYESTGLLALLPWAKLVVRLEHIRAS